jgi:uncharacterized lipoprotein YmbA
MKRWLIAVIVVPLLLMGGCGRYVYGDYSEATFLSSCERNGSGVAYCGCALDWIEHLISPAQLANDVVVYQQTGTPPGDMEFVKFVCTFAQVLY